MVRSTGTPQLRATFWVLSFTATSSPKFPGVEWQKFLAGNGFSGSGFSSLQSLLCSHRWLQTTASLPSLWSELLKVNETFPVATHLIKNSESKYYYANTYSGMPKFELVLTFGPVPDGSVFG